MAGVCREAGVEITELSTHLQGQLVAVHPAYDAGFDAFAAPAVHGNPKARQRWAVKQVLAAAKASRNLGLKASVTFSGALAWPYLVPVAAALAGLIEAAFDELAKRWKPIFDAYDDAGVDVGFELHPGEDLMDGATFEMLLERVGGHPRCGINYDPSHFVLQQLDYLDFIDIYHERIYAFHVKDAEFNPTGRQGVYSGFQGWVDRARALPLAGRRAGRLRRRSSRSSPSTTTTAGRCSSGSARSSIPSRARPRARRSSRATSSASPSTPSTTSPAARRT